ncbi:MAG TPA: hypothetical protein VKE72_10670 [Methylocella sp.]|nr:hypothetical protein [Methylocella sp.]
MKAGTLARKVHGIECCHYPAIGAPSMIRQKRTMLGLKQKRTASSGESRELAPQQLSYQ